MLTCNPVCITYTSGSRKPEYLELRFEPTALAVMVIATALPTIPKFRGFFGLWNNLPKAVIIAWFFKNHLDKHLEDHQFLIKSPICPDHLSLRNFQKGKEVPQKLNVSIEPM